MKLTDWNEESIKESVENFFKNRPPNGCDCPSCMRSWKKEKEFAMIADKDAYFKERIESYTVCDLVFDTTKDITGGDRLFWTDTEKGLCEKYRNTFGFLSRYSPMMDFGDMGKDVDYDPKSPKDIRAAEYIVDVDLVFANAISDNPKLDLMTDGEIQIFNQLRAKVYRNPEQRVSEAESHKEFMKDIFSVIHD